MPTRTERLADHFVRCSEIAAIYVDAGESRVGRGTSHSERGDLEMASAGAAKDDAAGLAKHAGRVCDADRAAGALAAVREARPK
jgi:hypothetical protein